MSGCLLQSYYNWTSGIIGCQKTDLSAGKNCDMGATVLSGHTDADFFQHRFQLTSLRLETCPVLCMLQGIQWQLVFGLDQLQIRNATS